MGKIFKLLILSVILNLNIHYAFSENSTGSEGDTAGILNLNLNGDVLYRSDPGGVTKLYDKVMAVSRDANTLYYIRSSGDKWIAGFFRREFDGNIEFDIPDRYEELYRFAGSNNVFYFMVKPVKDNVDLNIEKSPILIRFNPDHMQFQSIEGISDFTLLDGKILILRDNCLDYNGLIIPLQLTGNIKISGVTDSRIAIIAGVDGSEIVDLIAGKSIYQYKNISVPEYPGEYNLIMEFSDKITDAVTGPDTGNSIYYEILIDGIDENRTETGRKELTKTFHSTLAPGKYHIIKPERWDLDKTKGRYIRMNNIYQPAELKIYIPENRILKIKIEFDGTDYSVIQSVLFK